MLPDHLIRDLRYLEVYTAKKIRNLRVGAYTSRLRGAGFDFEQHRLYRPGADVRRIDWNVTARLVTPFVRETHAERELNLMIALDVSRSMEFGTTRYAKRELMVYVAACLVFSAVADQINTGFLAFTDRVLAYQPPRRTRARAWSILEEIWRLSPPHGQTAILPAVRFLVDRLKKPSVVFLVSDFMSEEDLFGTRDLKILAARHDAIAVAIEDPAETALPDGSSAITVRDMESGREARIGLSRALRARYDEVIRQRRDHLARSFYRVPMDHVFLRSDQNVIEPLLRLFAARRRPS